MNVHAMGTGLLAMIPVVGVSPWAGPRLGRMAFVTAAVALEPPEVRCQPQPPCGDPERSLGRREGPRDPCNSARIRPANATQYVNPYCRY